MNTEYIYVVEAGYIYESGRAIAAAMAGDVAVRLAFEYMKKRNDFNDRTGVSPKDHFGEVENNWWENGSEYVCIRSLENGILEYGDA
jgi:hypothetical protein